MKPLQVAAVVLLMGATSCAMIPGSHRADSAPPGEKSTADLGMAPYAAFANSAGGPASGDASAASAQTLRRGPAASNYNGPNIPPDPPPGPTAEGSG